MDVMERENVYANWIRNGLITTLIALTLFGFSALIDTDKEKKYLNLIRLVATAILFVAIYTFFISDKVAKTGNIVGYFYIIILLLVIAIIFFIN